jgi:TetR/AcrR family transcriptional regulator, cholesterol catabolism regulator
VTSDGAGNPRRAQIIEIAAELFDRRGYHDTTMQAIADRAGIRKPSLYYYFRSKDEILVELHESLMTVVIGRHSDRLAEGALGQRELLRGMMRDVIGLMESHPGYLRIFFESYRELPLDVRTSVSAQRSRYRRMVSDVLATGAANGEFGDIDPELTSIAVLSLMNWTYQWFRRSGPLTAEEVADRFWRMLLDGIG